MEASFDDVLELLRLASPLPPSAVVAGSWVIGLYRHHLGIESRPIATLDVDFALSTTSGNHREHSAWFDRFAQAAIGLGYHEDVLGGDIGAERFTVLVPPPNRRHLPRIEVIAELQGGPGKRQPTISKWFGKHLLPQEVRDLEILFAVPWHVEILPGETVAVPNPLSFVLQKALIREQRQRRNERGARDAAGLLEVALLLHTETTRLAGLSASLQAHCTRCSRLRRKARTKLDLWFLRDPWPAMTGALRALPPGVSIAGRPEAVALLSAFLSACGEPMP